MSSDDYYPATKPDFSGWTMTPWAESADVVVQPASDPLAALQRLDMPTMRLMLEAIMHRWTHAAGVYVGTTGQISMAEIPYLAEQLREALPRE